jgi:hypothetical protein
MISFSRGTEPRNVTAFLRAQSAASLPKMWLVSPQCVQMKPPIFSTKPEMEAVHKNRS